MTPEEFIEKMAVYAPLIKARGYFPSVFISQGAKESGWGKSILAQYANNFWGHKWKKESDIGVYDWMLKETPEERNGVLTPEDHPFRIYPTIDIAIAAYCNKYEECWPDTGRRKYDPDFSSPQAFIYSVAETYCTDSKYAERICEMIEEWDLEQYDK